MASMNGRRIGERSRFRAGNLMNSNGEVMDHVQPTEPGGDPDEISADDPTYIDIGVSIGL